MERDIEKIIIKCGQCGEAYKLDADTKSNNYGEFERQCFCKPALWLSVNQAMVICEKGNTKEPGNNVLNDMEE